MIVGDQLIELMDKLVADIGNFAATLGISRAAGQLYILLFLSAKPVSLDEMGKRLKISKGHVSTNIRALERWQAVRKVWVRGSRKDYYEANTNTISVITNQLKLGLQQRLAELDKIILRAKENIQQTDQDKSKTTRDQIKNLRNKLKKIEKMYKKAEYLLTKVNFLMLLA
ncbi:MAG: hypothetical protein ABH952_05175 [Candidatus Omnitrophota bacterium]